MSGVDIETEWNLKHIHKRNMRCGFFVDIETEWNLKVGIWIFPEKLTSRYRNRVEFKGNGVCAITDSIAGRYRNRVEFKGFQRTLSHP